MREGGARWEGILSSIPFQRLSHKGLLLSQASAYILRKYKVICGLSSKLPCSCRTAQGKRMLIGQARASPERFE
jgi:hypothetical protein